MQHLQQGDQAKILDIQSPNSAYRARLLAMGLLPQTTFSVTRVAPLNDPIEIAVRGVHLSLRRQEAKCLIIERLSNASS